MTAPAHLASLADALSPGTLALLPTAESARAFRRLFDETQRARNLTAWQPANILSWQQFLDQLWSESIVTGIDPRLLLNAAQEHALWLDTVAHKPAADTLTSPDALAALAAQAWSLAWAYNASSRLRASANTHDARTFAQWAELFSLGCRRNQYLTRAELPSALAAHIASGKLSAPPALTLSGFLHLTPSQQTLLEALRSAGTTINEQPIDPAAPTTHLYAAPSEQQEFHAIAAHLRQTLEQNPAARIAVLLPDAAEAPALDSIFRELLAPELESIHADPSSAPWELANAGPLAAQPILSVALDLAHFAQAPLELNRLSALLLSPYLGTIDDRDIAARFDAETLRRHPSLRPEISLATLHRLTQRTAIHPRWIKPLHQFLTNTPLEMQRSFADWAEFTRTLLASANWPGPHTLTSLEYQASEAFDALLDQISTLDFRGRRVPYATFLHTLTRHAADTPFTPASTNAPIQVLSPSAALAQPFDLIVFARATDANYPAPERINPLLSFTLQSQLDMPGANPASAGTRARQAFAQLTTAAPNILLTYTEETAEGRQRQAPLFESLSPERWVPAPEPSTGPISLTETPDTATLPPLPAAEVTGGAGLLKLQAACGFLAFAELRLRSAVPEPPSTGFDARESGNIIHDALRRFWREVQTRDTLEALTAEQRREILTRSIDLAIPTRFRTENDWDEAYLALQKDRLHILLDNWLNEELRRAPFTVLDSEKEELITVGPLTLKVRIDRIDQVEGGHVFIDYKTGVNADPKQWQGDRPDDPQLPLYSFLSQPEELKALAFARIRPGNGIEWRGYQSEPDILPLRNKTSVQDIDAAIAGWRTVLEALAHDFAGGGGDVNPKDITVNCRYCAQRLLCRINPEAFLAQAGDTTEEEDANE